jgi:hypothetical protein
LTRAEEQRLAGLPEWFSGNDANGDGQVAMAEYSSYWTDAKAREFLSYDHNGDGVITQREAVDGRAEGGVPAGPGPGFRAPGGPGPGGAGPGGFGPGGAGPGGSGPGGRPMGPPAGKPPASPENSGDAEKPWWLQ